MPGAANCPNCGAPVAVANNAYGQQPQYQQPQYQQGYPQQQGYAPAQSQEDAAIWLKIICLLIPIVGIIMYFVNSKSAPVKAKSCILFAGIGMALNLLFALF